MKLQGKEAGCERDGNKLPEWIVRDYGYLRWGCIGKGIDFCVLWQNLDMKVGGWMGISSDSPT